MLSAATLSMATMNAPDMRIICGERFEDSAMTAIIPIDPNMGRIMASVPVIPSDRTMLGGVFTSTRSCDGAEGCWAFVRTTISSVSTG